MMHDTTQFLEIPFPLRTLAIQAKVLSDLNGGSHGIQASKLAQRLSSSGDPRGVVVDWTWLACEWNNQRARILLFIGIPASESKLRARFITLLFSITTPWPVPSISSCS